MIKKILNLGRYSWLFGAISLFAVYQLVSGMVTGYEKNARRQVVLGQDDVSVSGSVLSRNGKLPLVRMSALNNEVRKTDVDDSLFFARKEEKTEEVYVQPVEEAEPVVDVIIEVKRFLILTGTLDNGAILNGRFYQLGDVIKQSHIRDEDGALVEAKLISVNENGVSLSVAGKIEKIGYSL